MKKFLVRLILLLVVILVLAVLGVGFFLDGIVKRGIETAGPKLTKVDVKLNSVRLSVLSGSGRINGLVVGNPTGFKAPQAIRVGSAALALKPRSLFSDKIVIRQIEILAPEITLEVGLRGNNLGRILDNVNETAGGGTPGATPQPESSAGKKLQVDDFLIKDARVSVAVTELGGQAKTVTIPEIHLANLGTGPEGITGAELLKRILPILEQEALKAGTTVFPELKKNLDELTQSLGRTAGNSMSNLTRSLDQSTGGTLTNLTRGLNQAGGGGVSNVTKSLGDLLNKK